MSNLYIASAAELVLQAEKERGPNIDSALRAAQVQATLALAYEQRTANLMALQAFYLAEGTGPSQSALDQIHERVGLT